MKKIAILSSGLDKRKDRGYENSSYNLFSNLKSDKTDLYKVDLYKGTGKRKNGEFVVRSFASTKIIHFSGNKIFNDTYVFEYIVFALFYIFYNWFNRRKYDVIYTQEPRTAKTLYQLKFLLVGKPKIVFGMGVKMTSEHYINICDRAQIVNIEHFNEAQKSFPESNKFVLIPNPGSIKKSYSSCKGKSFF